LILKYWHPLKGSNFCGDVYQGLRGLSGIVIGVIVDLDIFFLAFISDASINSGRSLAPAETISLI
jgi:aquaporin Z